jgi:hypothetical protein
VTRVPRLLTIMGSGETSPTMVGTHRRLFDRLGPPPVPAVLLDTPFGFQENAADIAERAVEYFRVSVGADVAVASYRRAADADALATETMLRRLRAARYVFAGPGSPSYALRQWAGTQVPVVLAEKLATGGCVTFASAAALTLGVVTVPVYEIYKVGSEPVWLDGLDLLAATGLRAAVIPHYDNAEGGNHDTRYCYLGERRLAWLERELPDDVFVLGVDEHTGLILDLDGGRGCVVGRGGVTVRAAGRSVVFPAGSDLALGDLGAAAGEARSSSVSGPVPPVEASLPPGAPPAAGTSPLVEEIRRLAERFDAALVARDVAAAVAAVLDLDTTLVDWSRDTLQSDQLDTGRSVLRSMVVRLGEAAELGLRDPTEAIAPLVDGLLEVRDRARRAKDYAAADAVRDRLLAAGVEVRDAPEGTTWGLLA